MNEAIQVWPWEDAPEEFRRLSQNGGDEDWVAFVPHKYKDMPLPWLENNGFDSCYAPQVLDVRDGVVYIGAHA